MATKELKRQAGEVPPPNGNDDGAAIPPQLRALGNLLDTLIDSGARMIGDVATDRVQVELLEPGDFYVGRLLKCGRMKEANVNGQHGTFYHFVSRDGTATYLNGSFDLDQKLTRIAAGQPHTLKPELSEHVIVVGLMSVEQLDAKRTLKVYAVIDCGTEFPTIPDTRE